MGFYIGDWQADVRVRLDGNLIVDQPWSTYSGADLTSTTGKTRPGNMGHEVDTGGQATRNDATLTIPWTEPLLARFKKVEGKVGFGNVTIVVHWKDKRGKRIPGGVITRTGTLKGCNQPNYDTNGNATGMCQIVVGMDQVGA
jgi:hypothetical protein